MTQATTDDELEEPDASHRDDADERAHLEGVDDGCGCTEVWEHLSEEREAGASD